MIFIKDFLQFLFNGADNELDTWRYWSPDIQVIYLFLKNK